MNEFILNYIFVQISSYDESESSLLEVYQKMSHDYFGVAKLLRVLDPYEGMPVAVYDEHENSWCRAEVLQTYPNNSKLDVMLVDYGITKQIELKHVRYLKSIFTKHEVSVI